MDKITARNEALAGKIASVFKRRNKMSATAQPPPYILDRHCRFERLISVATITLLLLLSIPALALKAYSYSFVESNVEMGFYLVDEQTGETQTNALVAALPLNIFRVPEKLVLVVSMISILLSIIHLAFIAWDWKTCLRTQTNAFRRNTLILHSINAILVLTALIALFVSHKTSSTFQPDLIPREPNAVSPSGYRYYRYDPGTFDLETWTCELTVPKAVGEARKDYQIQCNIEVAGRTIMVPFFLVALAMSGLSAWALISGSKHTSHNEHIYTKDADLELGRESEDGKQVHVEEVELATLQVPERQVDARLSKIEEDGEETEEPSSQAQTTIKVEDADSRSLGAKSADTKKIDGTS